MSHWSNEHAVAYDTRWGELGFHREIPLLAGVCKNDKIVEIGCGGGFLSICLASYAEGVVVQAIDPTPQMITLAEQRRKEAGISKARLIFEQKGAEALKVELNSIDIVIAAFSLHHWTDAEAAMLQIVQGLKKGGKIWLCEDLNTPTEGDISVNDDLKAYHGIKILLEKFKFVDIKKQHISTIEGEFLIVEAFKPT